MVAVFGIGPFERVVDFQQESVGGDLVGHFLPVDHAIDEIDGVIVAGERQQDTAIQHGRAALVHEFRFEADRRLVGEDLHVMVGDAAQQRAAGNIVQRLDLVIGVALAGELCAEIGDGRIFDTGSEVEQNRERTEIVERFGLEVFDAGEAAVFQQAGPEIIGPDLHAPLVLSDRRGGRLHFHAVILLIFAEIVGVDVVIPTGCSEFAAQRVHQSQCPWLCLLRAIGGPSPQGMRGHGKHPVKGCSPQAAVRRGQCACCHCIRKDTASLCAA